MGGMESTCAITKYFEAKVTAGRYEHSSQAKQLLTEYLICLRASISRAFVVGFRTVMICASLSAASAAVASRVIPARAKRIGQFGRTPQSAARRPRLETARKHRLRPHPNVTMCWGSADAVLVDTRLLLPASAECPVELHKTLILVASGRRQSELRVKQ
jgi:hypothetical protein